MPVPPPPAPAASQHQHQHNHHSSLFSSIGSLLQSFHHSNPSAVVPSPQHAPNSPYQDLLHGFEEALAQRLSSLTSSSDNFTLNSTFLKQSMEVLLATHSDLKSLLRPHIGKGLSPARKKMVDEFLERSIKLLDVCRAIKEQIYEAEALQGTLELVILSLSPWSSGNMTGYNKGQLRRALRALRELMPAMEKPQRRSSDDGYRSFNWSHSHEEEGSIGGHDHPHRWKSWHLNSIRGGGSSHGSLSSCSSSSSSQSLSASTSKQLQAVFSALVAPRNSFADIEESFCAAIYGFNVVAVFVLFTIAASLPSSVAINFISFFHPKSFLWAQPLAHLQDKVQHQLQHGGRSQYASILELCHIASIVKNLFRLIYGCGDGAAVLSEEALNEVKSLVGQLEQEMCTLKRDMGSLGRQVNEFSRSIVTSRMEILDMLSTMPTSTT